MDRQFPEGRSMSEPSESVLGQLALRAPDFAEMPATAGEGKEAFARDTREPYQRDLGRIVHSASFRMLQTKTQVMGTGVTGHLGLRLRVEQFQ
jgi:dGTPase